MRRREFIAALGGAAAAPAMLWPRVVRAQQGFQYQLGRALVAQGKDRRRALEIQQKLVGLRYPAAHDNLGWLIISERKNYSEAVAVFRAGIQLGDPDSMVSLAEMLDRGATAPSNPSETKMALFTRAAQLGHAGAAQALKLEQEQESQQENKRAVELEQQKRAMQMMQMILQNVGRR